jgi:hypothetical protein
MREMWRSTDNTEEALTTSVYDAASRIDLGRFKALASYLSSHSVGIGCILVLLREDIWMSDS